MKESTPNKQPSQRPNTALGAASESESESEWTTLLRTERRGSLGVGARPSAPAGASARIPTRPAANVGPFTLRAPVGDRANTPSVNLSNFPSLTASRLAHNSSDSRNEDHPTHNPRIFSAGYSYNNPTGFLHDPSGSDEHSLSTTNSRRQSFGNQPNFSTSHSYNLPAGDQGHISTASSRSLPVGDQGSYSDTNLRSSSRNLFSGDEGHFSTTTTSSPSFPVGDQRNHPSKRLRSSSRDNSTGDLHNKNPFGIPPDLIYNTSTMPTHAKRPKTLPGEGSDEDYNPGRRRGPPSNATPAKRATRASLTTPKESTGAKQTATPRASSGAATTSSGQSATPTGHYCGNHRSSAPSETGMSPSTHLGQSRSFPTRTGVLSRNTSSSLFGAARKGHATIAASHGVVSEGMKHANADIDGDLQDTNTSTKDKTKSAPGPRTQKSLPEAEEKNPGGNADVKEEAPKSKAAKSNTPRSKAPKSKAPSDSARIEEEIPTSEAATEPAKAEEDMTMPDVPSGPAIIEQNQKDEISGPAVQHDRELAIGSQGHPSFYMQSSVPGQKESTDTRVPPGAQASSGPELDQPSMEPVTTAPQQNFASTRFSAGSQGVTGNGMFKSSNNLTATANAQQSVNDPGFPAGSGTFNFSVPNPAQQNFTAPPSSFFSPQTPQRLGSFHNAPVTPAGQMASAAPAVPWPYASLAPGNGPAINYNARPGTFSAPRDPNRVIPENVYTSLEHHMDTRGVLDETDRLWVMGVQYGIGIGIMSYKAGLMDEIESERNCFGYPMRNKHFGENGPAIKARIESTSAEYYDLLRASIAGDMFTQCSDDIAQAIVTQGIEGVLGPQGMIGTGGTFPDQPQTGAYLNALNAAVVADGPSVSAGAPANASGMTGPSAVNSQLPPQMQAAQMNQAASGSFTVEGHFIGDNDNGNDNANANGNTGQASFTAGGNFVGGIDMSRLDGNAALVANALNATQIPAGMTHFTPHPSELVLTDEQWRAIDPNSANRIDAINREAINELEMASAGHGAGEDEGQYSGDDSWSSGPENRMNIDNAAAGDTVQGVCQAAGQVGEASGSQNNSGQATLTENEQGQAVITMVPKDN